MVEEPQGQGGLDGEIRVAPLPTPPAARAGRPGSDRFRGQPYRHIAASNEGLIVGRPVRNAVLRLVPGMDLRLHPCSVDPAEGPEKCGPRRPTRAGPSCNNAEYGPHGNPATDYFWAESWTVPQNYPTGSLGYNVIVTMQDDSVVTWEPFTRPATQLAIIEGAPVMEAN